MPRCQFESRRKELVHNLLNIYGQADASDVEQGIVWYPEAQRIVREWSSHYRYSIDTVACVVASLSPQLEWKRNLVIADDVLASRVPSIGGVLMSNLRKAETLRDRDYQQELGYSLSARMLAVFPQGPKVNSFAYNLAGDMRMVTVDTHACQAALNNPLATVRLGWTPYKIFTECYAHAAVEVDRQPAEFQAIVWHVWKRLYPRVWKIQHRTQWFNISTEDES